MAYERNYDLINRKFKELFFPTMGVVVAGNFAILIDAILISLILGPNYLSVIQCVEPFALFFTVIYWMIGMGGSILCSIAKAEFDDEKGNALFTVSLLSVVALSLTIVGLSLLFPDSIAQILCNSVQLRPLVNQYISAYLIGVPFFCYMIVTAYFIKSFGFIKLQFWAYLLCNIVNITCDIVFMNYLDLSIAGAGLATTTGYIVSAIIISYYFISPKKSLKLIKVKLSSMLGYFVEICKTGISIASTQLYASIKFLFVNALILTIAGEMGLAAMNICYNVLFLVLIFLLAVTQSILPIVSVYYKEEDFNGVDYVTHKSLKIVIALGIFFSLLFIAYPETILTIFILNSPAEIPMVVESVRLFSLCFVSYAICYLYIFYAQSVQYNKLANLISLLEGLILPIIITYLFGYLWGIKGIWIGFTVAESLTVLFIYIYSKYYTKKSNHEYSGFFLNKSGDEGEVWEFTLKGTEEDVSKLSEEIKDHLHESESGMKVCLAMKRC